MKSVFWVMSVLVWMFAVAGSLQGQELSIYELQYTQDPNGTSPQHGNIVDCRGGIVIHKWLGGRPRLTLCDPNYPYGWGGIFVKDIYSVGAFADVNVGDWVTLVNVEVEDFKGTTFLQYNQENDANLRIVSRDNVIPEPLPLQVSEIAAPIEGVDEWVVADHNAEKYEAMLVKVVDVNVADSGYGKAYDNYVLRSNRDPNYECWASDYMNEDRGPIYHPYVEPGGRFCGVTGILEQYTAETDGIYYDYYQLLTTTTADFLVEQYGDLNYDCGVDFFDFAFFAGQWLTDEQCGELDWCDGADLTKNGSVDWFDLRDFSQEWLHGRI
ncbi:MAG TPA: hypothetical protein VMX13_02430 [Sedimentisphaerales bacterium]|nr:hypothetical protein [Sedimentisphaerales bacterium]